MNPPYQRQIDSGNHRYPLVAPGVVNSSTRPDGKLWGANVRHIIGILQIICGGAEMLFGVAVLIIRNYSFDHMDYVGWGVWHGVFAIVTGSLGVFSLRNKGTVIAYMVTSIIAAVLCAGCFIYAVFGTLYGTYFFNLVANQALYIILCIIFFTQLVISIIGASFTCGAVCPTTYQSQQVVYNNPQPLPQQYDPSPPVVALQSGLTSQTISPGWTGTHVSAKTQTDVQNV